MPVPEYIEVPAKCQELSAEAESLAATEGCDSEAFAYAYASATVSCNADGSQSISLETNAEALAALEAQCGPPQSEFPCTDAFTEMANAAWVWGCGTPEFEAADRNAKNTCGGLAYDLLQTELQICVRTVSGNETTGGTETVIESGAGGMVVTWALVASLLSMW